MKNSETYFHNFESIDQNKKSILFIAGAGMDPRLVRAIRLPESEYNKPLIIDLPGHGDSKGSSSNSIESYSQFLIDALETNDLTLKKQFVQKAGDFTTIKNITLGAAAAIWIWNIVDATSSEGATKYAQNKPVKFNIVSDKNSSLALNFKYNF